MRTPAGATVAHACRWLRRCWFFHTHSDATGYTHPPMTAFDPWPAPPPIHPPTPPARRASLLLWVLSAVEVLGFGCCAASIALLTVLPPDDLRRMLAESGAPPEQVAMLSQQSAVVAIMAVLVLALGFVPGVLLGVLAFFVRRGSTPAIVGALVVVIAQGTLLGLGTLINIAGLVASGDLLGLTMTLVIFGGLLALLAACAWLLIGCLTGPRTAPQTPSIEPWDRE